MSNTNGSAPHTCDLLVHGAYLVTMDAERRVLPRGAVAIEGGRVVAVGPEAEIKRDYRGTRVLDARGGLVHPGFIESHVHISQHTSRSTMPVFHATDARVRYAEWKANLTPDDELAAARLGCLELLRAGYTAFVEPGTAFEPDAVAEAAETIGVRAWLTDPYLWDRSETLELYPTLTSPKLRKRVPCDRARCLKELGSQLARNRDPDALVRGHVALYGESTASDELQQAAKARARASDVQFTQHVGFAVEIADAEKKRLGKSQIQHMAALDILDADTTFVHMNVVEDADVEPIVDSGLSMIWCPANYLFVAAPSGARTRLPALQRRGANVALGIDGPGNCATGDTACIAYLAAREAGDAVSAETLLEMQTVNAARSIGDDDIGSLAPGMRADLVIRSPDALEWLGFDAAYELAVFSRALSVDAAIVNGKVVLDEGRSTLVDEGWVLAEARASMRRLVERVGVEPPGTWPVRD